MDSAPPAGWYRPPCTITKILIDDEYEAPTIPPSGTIHDPSVCDNPSCYEEMGFEYDDDSDSWKAEIPSGVNGGDDTGDLIIDIDTPTGAGASPPTMPLRFIFSPVKRSATLGNTYVYTTSFLDSAIYRIDSSTGQVVKTFMVSNAFRVFANNTTGDVVVMSFGSVYYLSGDDEFVLCGTFTGEFAEGDFNEDNDFFHISQDGDNFLLVVRDRSNNFEIKSSRALSFDIAGHGWCADSSGGYYIPTRKAVYEGGGG